ncbi:hypothetical protein KC573_00735 [candidate division WWE3 bacterium]|uniref:Uncharacterized protein n=1 Tax=candidate division WWE3 bacterium TaxID=2053526 RepID=A0A955RW04_UNCKA|nr:hypothetical protein [candidate division WWE3 bacterium]
MPNKKTECEICGEVHPTEIIYLYNICSKCESTLGLFSDKTITKHIETGIYKNKKEYINEIDRRLELMKKDYIKKQIKLLHIKDRLLSTDF